MVNASSEHDAQMWSCHAEVGKLPSDTKSVQASLAVILSDVLREVQVVLSQRWWPLLAHCEAVSEAARASLLPMEDWSLSMGT